MTTILFFASIFLSSAQVFANLPDCGTVPYEWQECQTMSGNKFSLNRSGEIIDHDGQIIWTHPKDVKEGTPQDLAEYHCKDLGLRVPTLKEMNDSANRGLFNQIVALKFDRIDLLREHAFWVSNDKVTFPDATVFIPRSGSGYSKDVKAYESQLPEKKKAISVFCVSDL